MKKSLMVAIGIALVFVIFGGTCKAKYNHFVDTNENIDGAWAQVENVLQRRADLIPNLVKTVKGFATHEKEIFTAVAQARSKLIGAKGNPAEAAEANAAMSSALGRLLAISERYPDLKSNQTFVRLQDELAGTENRITVERKRYNDAVRAYNKYVKRFPNNLLASLFNFEARVYFEADQKVKAVPEVNFD